MDTAEGGSCGCDPQYRKVAGNWLIASTVITRIRTDGTHPWSVQELTRAA